jgi:hypothetical protein
MNYIKYKGKKIDYLPLLLAPTRNSWGLSTKDTSNNKLDYQNFQKALKELDTKFPGATYDESLNNFIFVKRYKKEKAQNTIQAIIAITLGIIISFIIHFLLLPLLP